MVATDLHTPRSKRHLEDDHGGGSNHGSSAPGKDLHEKTPTIKHVVKKPQTHAAEVAHVPAPFPDGENHSPSYRHKSSSSTTAVNKSLQIHTTSFVPLPALKTLTVAPASAPISVSTYTPTSTSSSATASSSTHKSQSPGRAFKLSPLVISLISVGAACLLLVVLVAIIARPCSRRRRRKTLPKPSKPILDDEYSQTGLYDKLPESPMFGGKEHYSEGGLADGLPRTWTQYFHEQPSMDSYSTAAPHAQTQSRPSENQLASSKDPSWPPMPPQPPSPLRQAQDTLHNLASRLSMASMSVYRDSTYPATMNGVGIAISSPKVSEDNARRNERRQSRVGSRRSQLFEVPATVPSRRRSSELAYAGISSPDLSVFVPSTVVPVANGGGRTKIKSSYYLPGSYPRMSSIPSSLSTKMKASDLPNQPSMPAISSSESRRDRETQALTAAMGFGSPYLGDDGPLSPQLTIYPDDSLSMMETRRHSRRIQKKPAPRESTAFAREDAPNAIPAMPSMHMMDTSTALGSLMMSDFGTTSKSLAAMAGRGNQERGGLSSSESMKLSDDIPPRVPSPPPLPSLAQMGLEHHNPEAYANYKSPTYSIYNYYGEDRRSRLSLQNQTT